MAEYEEIPQRLRDALEMLEHALVEQASAEPKRADRLTKALADVTAALEAMEARQREQQAEERLSTLLDELARYARDAHKRLDASEARLKKVEQAGLDRGRRGFPPDPDLREEGRVLAGMLAGPPDASIAPSYFKDAGRVPIVASIDVLALELASRAQAAGKAGAKP